MKLKSLKGREFRVVAPHVPHLARGRDGRPPEAVVATYPFEDKTYTPEEAEDVLAIFTNTWRQRGWPASFEPVMVSADGGPRVCLTKRELDESRAADRYVDALAAGRRRAA